MMRSEDLVDKCEGVCRIKYHGAILYNVLMEKHDKMVINNLICETLHPNNIMAKICGGKYTSEEKKKLYNELNSALITNDLNACKKLYASLK
jgi:homoserine kinase